MVFPFWIVTQRRDLISMPVEPEGMPGYVAAFATAQDATTFMVGRGETSWEIKMISRVTLAPLLGDLRRLGVQGVCLNPTGDSPTQVGFDTLNEFAV